MYTFFRWAQGPLYIVTSLCIIGCEKQPPTSEQANATAVSFTAEKLTQRQFQTETEKLWSASPQSCQKMTAAAQTLDQHIQTLLANPTANNLHAAQQQWKALAINYGNLYLFTTIGEVLPGVFQDIKRLSWRVAAHPVQPGYLDAFGPYPYSGLVNDLSVELTPENLAQQHGFTDDSEIVLGLYSLEFMLFGEYRNRKIGAFLVAQQLTQNQVDAGFESIEETPIFRRRTMVASQAKLLSTDMKRLCQVIQTHTNTRSAAWREMPVDQRLDAIHQVVQRALELVQRGIDAQLLKNTEAAPVEYRHQYVLQAPEYAQFLSNQLAALTSTQDYIGSSELFALLELARNRLDAFASAEQPQAAPWQAVKDDIAKAIRLSEDIKKAPEDSAQQ